MGLLLPELTTPEDGRVRSRGIPHEEFVLSEKQPFSGWHWKSFLSNACLASDVFGVGRGCRDSSLLMFVRRTENGERRTESVERRTENGNGERGELRRVIGGRVPSRLWSWPRPYFSCWQDGAGPSLLERRTASDTLGLRFGQGGLTVARRNGWRGSFHNQHHRRARGAAPPPLPET